MAATKISTTNKKTKRRPIIAPAIAVRLLKQLKIESKTSIFDADGRKSVQAQY